MPKKKKKYLTTRQLLTRQSELKNLKQAQRSSRPILLIGNDKTPTPEGYDQMTDIERRVDTRRRAKEKSRIEKGQPGSVRVFFNFTPSEIGYAGPTEEEILFAEEKSVVLAKKMRNYNPLDHMIPVPHSFLRNPNLTMKDQWSQERQMVLQQLLSYQQNQEPSYSPEDEVFDLNNLTTARGSND